MFFLACALLAAYRPAQIKPSRLTWMEFVPAAKNTEKKAEKKDDDSARRQLVQTAPGNRVAKPVPDSFLGEHNQSVDRETVSKDRMTLMGKSQALPRHAQAQPDAKSANRNQPAKPLTDAARPDETVKPQALSQLGLPILPVQRNPKAMENLARDEPQWANIGAQPEDYVKGVKESDRTALNTREYMFFGYYQRIRERLELAWVPILREVLTKYYHSGRQLASDMDHTTKVLVTLNSSGEIVKVRVTSESGNHDLDDAAIRAFNKAGPFPNPPRGLVDEGRGAVEVPWSLTLRS